MALCAKLEQGCAENLVLMRVEHDVPDSGLLIHKPLPVSGAKEGIVEGEDSSGIAVADRAPGVVIEEAEA